MVVTFIIMDDIWFFEKEKSGWDKGYHIRKKCLDKCSVEQKGKKKKLQGAVHC